LTSELKFSQPRGPGVEHDCLVFQKSVDSQQRFTFC